MATDEIGRLRVLLSAETAEYIANVKKAKAETTDAASEIKGNRGVGAIQGVFSQLIAAGVVAKAGQMLVQFGQDSINASRDVAESMSKAEVVFAETFDSVQAELGAFSDATGRSQVEMIGWAATLQDTFVPLGFARDAAAEFSTEIVKLAVDLGSFNNLPTADVVRDIQSALVGNTETLRKYGVVASQAFIEQEALNTGLWDGLEPIDAQAKAMAIYQLLLKGTSDAQGDAVRTADSLANKQVALEAAVLDLQVAVGDKLAPATTFWTQKMIDAANAAELLVTWSDKLGQAHAEQQIAVRQGSETYEEYVDGTLAAAVAVGRLDQSWVNLHKEAILLGEASVSVTDDLRWLTEEQWNAYQAGMALEETDRKLAEAWSTLSTVSEPLPGLMLDQALAFSELSDAIGGVVGDYDTLKAKQDLINDAIASTSDTVADQQRKLLAMKLATEDLTEAEIAQLLTAQSELETLQLLNDALDSGAITWEQYLGVVIDGTVSIEEYNALLGITGDELSEAEQNALGARQQIEGVHDALAGLDGKTVDTTINVNVNQRGNLPPELEGEETKNVGNNVAAAHGLDMFIPPGYPNDTYRVNLALTSGERLLVLTQDQQRKLQLPQADRSINIGTIILPAVKDAPTFLQQMESYRISTAGAIG